VVPPLPPLWKPPDGTGTPFANPQKPARTGRIFNFFKGRAIELTKGLTAGKGAGIYVI
jgi:hypothetical protein